MADLFTVREVAQAFGVHGSTVRRWFEEGRLPYIKTPSGQYRVRREEIAARLVEQTVDKAAA